jgi:F-type H+-transporting ATPase subunit alpha
VSAGVIIGVGGVVVVDLKGLRSGFIGELFTVAPDCPAISNSGMIVNISVNNNGGLTLGGLLINSDVRVVSGSEVICEESVLSIKLGDSLLSAIIDPCGNILTGSDISSSSYRWTIESPAPGIMERESVFEPLQSGLIAVDSMVPIGRGQRELVVGDRQTGKTSIGVDTILNQKYENVFCSYCPIGQKASAVLEVFLCLVRRDAIANVSIVVASAATSAVAQFLCAYTGIAVAEFFMLVKESPCFVMFDDLSRHAIAYREIYLLLRRPPGREAYPGEIFFVHSRLLERSAKIRFGLGGGSVTAFPVIETLAGDVSAYITTNVISITDGQIFLSIDLFLSGIKPAVDIGLSVTRVGSAAQWVGMTLVSGSSKLELAQFFELQAFAQFSSDLGADTKAKLERGKCIVKMLRQFCGKPQTPNPQIISLSCSNQDIFSELSIHKISHVLKLIGSIPTWIYLL